MSVGCGIVVSFLHDSPRNGFSLAELYLSDQLSGRLLSQPPPNNNSTHKYLTPTLMRVASYRLLLVTRLQVGDIVIHCQIPRNNIHWIPRAHWHSNVIWVLQYLFGCNWSCCPCLTIVLLQYMSPYLAVSTYTIMTSMTGGWCVESNNNNNVIRMGQKDPCDSGMPMFS